MPLIVVSGLYYSQCAVTQATHELCPQAYLQSNNFKSNEEDNA